MKDIRAFPIAGVPTLQGQQQVVEKLEDIRVACGSTLKLQLRKLAALDELKKSLLHQAFTGACPDAATLGQRL
jgi:type I restriction enzyme S subunit